MARQNIPVTQAPGPAQDDYVELVFTDTDGVNDDEVTWVRGLIIIALATGGSADATIEGAKDSQGRTEDIVDTLTSGQRRMYGPFEKDGWVIGGKINLKQSAGAGTLSWAAIDPRQPRELP